MRRGIAIGGPMGTGKSTVGLAVAARMGLPLVDMDAVLAERYGPISIQFRDEGEAVFRARERALVYELVAGAPCVIATGGGTWADPQNRSALRTHLHTVVLEAPLEVLRRRVGEGPGRPLWADMAALIERRGAAYRDADALVDASRSVDAVASDVVAAADPVSVERVELPRSRAYDVALAAGFGGLGDALARAGVSGRAFLVTEVNVAPLWADRVEQSIAHCGIRLERIVLPAGERNKTLHTWSLAVDALLEKRVDRHAWVIALGGGVLGDIAGFAAASVMRGVRFIQLPTTLLSMVDSSVGGKTGVNHSRGKNLVGAFHQPALVFAALDTLDTLDPAERVAGLGEVVKAGLIGGFLEELEADAGPLAAGDLGALRRAIRRSVRCKAEVVAADEREAGWRGVLNAGHTVGHALETTLGHGTLRHGEAVAIGLVAEARWAVRSGLCADAALPDRLATLLQALGLPADLPAGVDHQRMRSAFALDKKGRDDILSVPVPVRLGEFTFASLALADAGTLLGDPG
jgi:shikimate kinase / 3-dehydroquinate synthase